MGRLESAKMKPKRLFKKQTIAEPYGPFNNVQRPQQTAKRRMLFSRSSTSTTSRRLSNLHPANQKGGAHKFNGIVKSETLHTCSACNEQIRDKFLLNACGKYWHENCLKCDRCQAKLGELGATLYSKANMNLCRQDYFDIFGQTAICSVCNKLVYASEMVMRAKENVYHLECFACQLCCQRFCVGDRFYLCENKIVCQFDYEENILPIQNSMFAQSAAAAALTLRPETIDLPAVGNGSGAPESEFEFREGLPQELSHETTGDRQNSEANFEFVDTTKASSSNEHEPPSPKEKPQISDDTIQAPDEPTQSSIESTKTDEDGRGLASGVDTATVAAEAKAGQQESGDADDELREVCADGGKEK